MMKQADRDYFERRRLESLDRAMRATDPATAATYHAFAAHYEMALKRDRRRSVSLQQKAG